MQLQLFRRMKDISTVSNEFDLKAELVILFYNDNKYSKNMFSSTVPWKKESINFIFVYYISSYEK